MVYWTKHKRPGLCSGVYKTFFFRVYFRYKFLSYFFEKKYSFSERNGKNENGSGKTTVSEEIGKLTDQYLKLPESHVLSHSIY